MYYYFTPGGQELVTPNRDLAFARAAVHGSDVFMFETKEESNG